MSSADFPRINRLSAALVSQIAAGEVIERPASVIKELVENSLDAGADRIEIDIERGGGRLIRVRDNGHGIHPDDMPLALESHATSKLHVAADLEAIRSLGFRGEALSSIASVSAFQLISRMAGADRGWSLSLQPGGAAEPVPAAHETGTTVEVRDLFQSLPARRKFLRTERTEFLHILETVRRLALSSFDMDIRLQHNRRRILHCRPAAPDGDRRIQDILGSAFIRDALVVDSERGGMRLRGRLGGAALSRNQSDRQYFYLNGRMIRDKRINHAVRKALEDTIPPGRYPSYVLYLSVDPAVMDVNVHPTKQEVRFRHSRDVHDFIHAAVNEAMQDNRATQTAMPGPSQPAGPAAAGPAAQTAWPVREAAALYRSDRGSAAAAAAAVQVVSGRFILLTRPDGVVLIDGLEALRRVIHYRLSQGLEAGAVQTRPLLVPVILDCTAAEVQLVTQHQPLLHAAGLELEAGGPASLRVRSVPAALNQADIQTVCRALLAVLEQGGGSLQAQLIDTLARQGGATVPLPDTEVPRLLNALKETGVDPVAEPQPGLSRHLEPAELGQLLNHCGD